MFIYYVVFMYYISIYFHTSFVKASAAFANSFSFFFSIFVFHLHTRETKSCADTLDPTKRVNRFANCFFFFICILGR